MIKMALFQQSDLDDIKPRQIFDDDENLVERIRVFDRYAIMYTMRDMSDNLVAVVGAHELHKGTYEVWSITTDHIIRNGIGFIKSCRAIMSEWQRENKISRYQMVCRSGLKNAPKFAKMLGFKLEAIMEKFGPKDHTYLLFGRIN